MATAIDGAVEPEGEALVFTWTQRGARGVVEYRETFRFPDPDTYAGEAYKKSASGWSASRWRTVSCAIKKALPQRRPAVRAGSAACASE